MHLETAWDVYAWLLLEKGYGHPLWSPEPHEKGEVNIGSVGFIRQGRFYCLLNTSKPSDADENRRWGDLGPFRFRPFHIDPTDQIDNQRPLSTHILHSSSIAKWKYWRGDMGNVGIYLQCEDDQAALLYLCRSRTGLAYERRCCSRGIKDYIRRNQDEWHRIAAEHTDTDIKQGDLIFVTGWIKTSDCFLTACTHGAWSGFVNLDDGSEEISVTVSGHNGVAPGWEQKMSLHSRNEEASKNNASGPDGSQSDSNTNDRCIFIQYYKTKRRKILASSLSKLKASAQSRNSDDKSKGDASHGHIPSTRDYDPVDDILDYILSNSNARIAIASTEDVQLLRKQETRYVYSMKEILDENCPHVKVDFSGLGYLSLNPIRRSKVPKASGRSSACHERSPSRKGILHSLLSKLSL